MKYPDTVVVIDAEGYITVFSETRSEVAIVDFSKEDGASIAQGIHSGGLDCIPPDACKKLDELRDWMDELEHDARS